MKNVHILPTDQPSRLWINYLLQGKLELHEEILIGSNTAKHIYITSNNGNSVSDEGVHHNYGSWILDINNEKVFKTCVNIISGDDIQKIILTTDPTLIADGVQAIDDEFLEWFVKNPTCEEIEVEKGYLGMAVFIKSNELISKDKLIYKITIPQEEPKQEILPEFTLSKGVFNKISELPQEEPKQEIEKTMTAIEKALELVNKYKYYTEDNYAESFHNAKQCALITVDEIQKALSDEQDWYWEEVKNQIEKL